MHPNEKDQKPPEEYMRDYMAQLSEILARAGAGETGDSVVLIHGSREERTISIYSVNATTQETVGLLLTAAAPYTDNTDEERVLN